MLVGAIATAVFVVVSSATAMIQERRGQLDQEKPLLYGLVASTFVLLVAYSV